MKNAFFIFTIVNFIYYLNKQNFMYSISLNYLELHLKDQTKLKITEKDIL